jgi:hypothetical protein
MQGNPPAPGRQSRAGQHAVPAPTRPRSPRPHQGPGRPPRSGHPLAVEDHSQERCGLPPPHRSAAALRATRECDLPRQERQQSEGQARLDTSSAQSVPETTGGLCLV